MWLFILWLLGSGGLAVADCVDATRQWGQMQAIEIRLMDGSGRISSYPGRLAETAGKRAAGYQHICPGVIARTSILFVFSREMRSAFHMANVKAPLDIAFFDASGNLIDIQTMQPYAEHGPRPVYGPKRPFQFAWETRAGFFKEQNILENSRRLLVGEIFKP